MFERYTARARRVISRAREQASGSASSQIEPEYLLIGLLREDKLLADRFIGSSETVGSIEGRITSRMPTRKPQITSADLPLSHTSKRVLAFAAEESERLNHRHIGTEHILMGLLREKGTLAAMILNELGLQVEALRKRFVPFHKVLHHP